MPDTNSELWAFGCSVLGYDAFEGRVANYPEAFASIPAQIWTKTPSLYGFHATLKAPFELAYGASEVQLLTALQAFAQQQQAFVLPALQLQIINNFVALVPQQQHAALQDLASACVRAFEPFRAPLAAFDRERRLSGNLAPRQIDNLERWGYPYVIEDFAFHMSLSGALGERDCAKFYEILVSLYAPLAANLPIDAIAIFKQEQRGMPFTVLQREKFTQAR